MLGYKHFKDFPWQTKKSVLLRALLMFGSYLFLTVSVNLMPLSVSVTIIMTVSFFTALFAFLLHGEQISTQELYSMIISFIGVIMIFYPYWFNNPTSSSTFAAR